MSGDGGGSVAVLSDAQLSNVQVLRPYAGFEQVYQGQSASIPVAFPGTRDQRAGKPGFDTNLLAGIPVPLGSRVILWLPMTFNPTTGGQNYRYRVVWRLRNLNDYRDPGGVGTPRPPYHFPISRPVVNDTTFVPPQPRTIVPAGWRLIGFEYPLGPTLTDGQIDLRVEDIVPRFDDSLINAVRPLLQDGSSGTIQQGILDPATNPVGAPLPIFKPFWFDCEGDEIMILATRESIGGEGEGVWDFHDPALDLAFSNIYGTGDGAHEIFPSLGIYMMTGSTGG